MLFESLQQVQSDLETAKKGTACPMKWRTLKNPSTCSMYASQSMGVSADAQEHTALSARTSGK